MQGWILSDYAFPRLLNGLQQIEPSNLDSGPSRLAYLDGLLEYANSLLDRSELSGPSERKRIDELLAWIPMARESMVIVKTRGKARYQADEQFRDRHSGDPEKYTLLITDGRKRAPSVAVRTGLDTPAYGKLLRMLAGGASREELARAWTRLRVPEFEELLGDLIANRLVEPFDPGNVRSTAGAKARRARDGAGDSFTWLGHAGACLSLGGANIWVDPLLAPKLEWNAEDRAKLFSSRYADGELMERYDEFPGPKAPRELPRPDVVCITHQDVDHFDLGTLLLVPESVPIVVPEHTGFPWDVDLRKVLRQVLGKDRKVIVLRHGHSLRVGGSKVTAFPFAGEYPASLPHKWNCYLVESRRSVAVCSADSALGDEAAAFLSRRLRGNRRPFLLCARLPNAGQRTPGYQESDSLSGFLNYRRLWGWHVPVASLFDPVPEVGPSPELLGKLARSANLRWFFAYASGSVPWNRMAPTDGRGLLPLSSLERQDLRSIASSLRRAHRRLALFRGKYGVAVPIE